MTRQEQAVDNFRQGQNCCQAVVLAFKDLLPYSEQELLKITSAFGGGFAKTRNLCGAVSAIGFVLGQLYYETDKEINYSKTQIYKRVQKLTDEFIFKNNSLNCGELLKNIKNLTKDYVPQVRNAEYYEVRPCVKFVCNAVELIENEILENEPVLHEVVLKKVDKKSTSTQKVLKKVDKKQGSSEKVLKKVDKKSPKK